MDSLSITMLWGDLKHEIKKKKHSIGWKGLMDLNKPKEKKERRKGKERRIKRKEKRNKPNRPNWKTTKQIIIKGLTASHVSP